VEMEEGESGRVADYGVEVEAVVEVGCEDGGEGGGGGYWSDGCASG